MAAVDARDDPALPALPTSPRLIELVQQAQGGDPEAQDKVGRLFGFGIEVPQDAGVAAVWYRRGAEGGSAAAQRHLAGSLERGGGVTPDPVEAREWMRRAAEQGDTEASYDLGRYWRDGIGGARDPAQARSWLARAQAQGHAHAERALAALEREIAVSPAAARAPPAPASAESAPAVPAPGSKPATQAADPEPAPPAGRAADAGSPRVGASGIDPYPTTFVDPEGAGASQPVAAPGRLSPSEAAAGRVGGSGGAPAPAAPFPEVADLGPPELRPRNRALGLVLDSDETGRLAEPVRAHLAAAIAAARARFVDTHGIPFPAVEVSHAPLGSGAFVLHWLGSPVDSGQVEGWLYAGDRELLAAAGIECTPAFQPGRYGSVWSVADRDRQRAEDQGIALLGAADLAIGRLCTFAAAHLYLLVTPDGARRWLAQHCPDSPLLASDDALDRLACVLRALAVSQVPLDNAAIAGAFAATWERGGRLEDSIAAVRSAEGVREQLPGNSAEHFFYALDPALERWLADRIDRSSGVPTLRITEPHLAELHASLAARVGPAAQAKLRERHPELRPALLADTLPVRDALERVLPDELALAVLVRAELLPGLAKRIVGRITRAVPA